MAYTYGAKEDFSLKSFNVNNTFKINEKLLMKLLSIQSPSKNEGEMKKFIVSYIHANKIECKIDVDETGNILITKGEAELYPCFISHMDEVNVIQSDRTVIKLNNILIGLNAKTGAYAGIGADDSVGVYICLEALRAFENIKIAFVVEEEIGCIGSGKMDMKFFENVIFVFQADRKGDDEVIQYSNGTDLMGTEFKDFIKPEMEKWNYKFGNGTATDAGKLTTRGIGIVTMNISCGYWEAHTLEEKACIPSVENCMNLMFEMAVKCINENKRFIFVPEKKVYSYSQNYGGSSRYEDDYDYNNYGYNYKKNSLAESKKNMNERILKRTLTKEDIENLKEFNNTNYWEAFKVK